MRSILPAVTLALLLLSDQSLAQAPPAPAPACKAIDAVLPAEWAGWTNLAPISAAANESGLASAELKVGKAAKAHLPAHTSWVMPPEKAPAAGAKGGLILLNVAQPGRYAVGLGNGSWLDAVSGSTAQTPVGHGHGPDCSSIRKYVEYDLKPGRYVLQISGSQEPDVGILVIRRT